MVYVMGRVNLKSGSGSLIYTLTCSSPDAVVQDQLGMTPDVTRGASASVRRMAASARPNTASQRQICSMTVASVFSSKCLLGLGCA